MKAIVIGGGIGGPSAPVSPLGRGIGGLTAALSLLDRGIGVEVYEQAPALTEIGAGLQIGANASRVLARLGLGEQLDRLGVAIRALDMRDLRTDRPIHSMP